MKEGGLRIKGITKKNDANDLITIITVVFNGRDHIENTIKSVISQDYYNVEYIVIDGGSTDGTIQILSKYNDNLDYWISEPDDGIADAFNKGIKLAKGEVIGLINADDYFMPNALRYVMKIHSSSDPKIISGSMIILNHNRPDRLWYSTLAGFEREMTIAHPATFIPLSLYGKNGFFDLNFKVAMDYELLLRMKSQGTNFVLLENVLVTMRAGGISSKQYWRGLKEIYLCQKLYNKNFSPVKANLFIRFRFFQATTMQFLDKIGVGFFVSLIFRRKIFKKSFGL